MNVCVVPPGRTEPRAQIVPHGALSHHVHSVTTPAMCDTSTGTALNACDDGRIPGSGRGILRADQRIEGAVREHATTRHQGPCHRPDQVPRPRPPIGRCLDDHLRDVVR